MNNKRKTRRPSRRYTNPNATRLRTPADPPQVVSQPWNPLVVSREIVHANVLTPVSVNPANLSHFVREQVGLATTVPLNIRVLHVRGWNLSGNAIGMRTFDLKAEAGNTDPLTVLLDRPARNRWAKVGCKWPATQQVNSLQSTDTSTVIFTSEANVVPSTLLFQVTLMWRPASTEAPTRRMFGHDHQICDTDDSLPLISHDL